MHRLVVPASIVVALLLAGCGGEEAPEPAPAAQDAAPEPTPTGSPSPEPVDPAAVDADELGMVPVLMYHRVIDDPAGAYDQSPEEFRTEIERLYAEDYRPVTAADFVAGDIDVPAGMHPVVMTFDDSSVSQIQLDADGEPDPDTAVGILTGFAEDHPDFAPTATFYVNNTAFADDGESLEWLVEHGYEVGVHTATHANLGKIGSDAVQEEIVTNLREIADLVPDAEVSTMALPFGVMPDDPDLAHAGSWDSEDYDLDGVMLVGANPAPSPFDAEFDPDAIPRIRSGLGEVPSDSAYWLDYLDQNPDERYTSDGDPDAVSYPESSSVEVAAGYEDAANPYLAEEDSDVEDSDVEDSDVEDSDSGR